jgi:hypothetical protein
MGPSDELHTGLRVNTLRKEQRAGMDLVLGQVVLGKDRAVYAVHARPSIFTTHGVQALHLLGALGFQWIEHCQFTSGGAACRRVDEDFDLGAFADALEKGYELLKQAGGHLEACGYDAVEFDNPGAKFIFVRPVENASGATAIPARKTGRSSRSRMRCSGTSSRGSMAQADGGG